MKSVEVVICSGTACYVQGGSYLFDLEENLTPDEVSAVTIRGTSCLGYCSQKREDTPPYALVGDRCIGSATVHDVITEIRRQLQGGS